jgi:Protein of unknown function (DUF1629)
MRRVRQAFMKRASALCGDSISCAGFSLKFFAMKPKGRRNVSSGKSRRKLPAQKFHKISPSFTPGLPGFNIENIDKLLDGGQVLRPPTGGRGFPTYPEPPRLLIDTRMGRLPLDCETYHEYWLVSESMKSVLEAIDPEGCAFLKCEINVVRGDVDCDYWLCDVLRMLDAVDEVTSRLTIRQHPDGRKIYWLLGASLTFKLDVVGSAHIFRLAFMKADVFCDQQVKEACKAEKLKGVQFTDARKL